jgi:hypothetical protein
MSTPSLERRLDALEGRRESLEKVSAFRAWVADGGRAEDFEKEWPKLRDEGRRAASLLPGLRGSLLSASRRLQPTPHQEVDSEQYGHSRQHDRHYD